MKAMKRSGQRSRSNGGENPRGHYAVGLWPEPASPVRGSSRRIMTMKASSGSILEYQTDQPSSQLPGPLTGPLHPPSPRNDGAMLGAVKALRFAPTRYAGAFGGLDRSCAWPQGRYAGEGGRVLRRGLRLRVVIDEDRIPSRPT